MSTREKLDDLYTLKGLLSEYISLVNSDTDNDESNVKNVNTLVILLYKYKLYELKESIGDYSLTYLDNETRNGRKTIILEGIKKFNNKLNDIINGKSSFGVVGEEESERPRSQVLPEQEEQEEEEEEQEQEEEQEEEEEEEQEEEEQEEEQEEEEQEQEEQEADLHCAV